MECTHHFLEGIQSFSIISDLFQSLQTSHEVCPSPLEPCCLNIMPNFGTTNITSYIYSTRECNLPLSISAEAMARHAFSSGNLFEIVWYITSTEMRAIALCPLGVDWESNWWPWQTICIQMRPHKIWSLIWYQNWLRLRLYISKQWIFANERIQI